MHNCVLLCKLLVYSQHLVSAHGTVKYSKVRTFLRKNQASINMYKSIATSCNNTIRLTGNHLIYAKKHLMDKFIPM